MVSSGGDVREWARACVPRIWARWEREGRERLDMRHTVRAGRDMRPPDSITRFVAICRSGVESFHCRGRVVFWRVEDVAWRSFKTVCTAACASIGVLRRG